MALKKITGTDFKEAVDWLWGHKAEGGCVHQVLGTTNDGTKLCFVVGWSKGADYGDDDKKYGYFDEGYCISAKIGYQHRNNAMQTDYDWDFNMPYDLETGDVWDTSSYVPRDADWEREAADYNKEAEKIWAAYGDPDKEGKTALDLMESKKKESLADNANLDFKVGDFKGTRKSVISKIKKALDNKGIANEVVADGRCLEVTLDNANVVIQTIAAGGYGSNNSASYVVLGKDSDNYRNQTDAYSIKDVMDYIEDAKGGKSESKKHTCSMQKKKESLLKKSEATYNPDKVKADEMRLDYLSGVDDFYEGVKKYGFDLDDNGYWGSGKDGVYYRTIWLKNGKRTSGPNTNHIVKIGYDTNENTPFVAIDQYVLGNVQDLLTVIADNFAPKTMEALAKKSESKKSEDVYGTIRVDSEDIAIKVQESQEYPSSSGRSLTVEVPKVEAWFSTLSEFSDCIDGLAENCNGYPDISRDGSDILVQIYAPKEDESDDYEVIVELRCSTEITSTSLEGVVDLLNHD